MEPDASSQMSESPVLDAETVDQIIGERALEAITVLRKGEVVAGVAISAMLTGGVKDGQIEVRTAVQINGEPATILSALDQARASVERTYREAGLGHLVDGTTGPDTLAKPLTPPSPLPAAPAADTDLIAFLDHMADRLDDAGAREPGVAIALEDLANDCRRRAAKARRAR